LNRVFRADLAGARAGTPDALRVRNEGGNTMKTMREWAFPAGLLLSWFIASAYTLSALAGASSEHQHLMNPVAATSPQT
jgi:hypothetical protein